jgi:very-long-chain enoyl-CoA reductase
VKKSIHRLSFKYEENGNTVRLDDDSKSLESYGVNSSTTLIFKDLGPQIGYRTVFLVEYFGPMLFVSLYALRPALIYGESAATAAFNSVAWLGVICWNLHFLKRELETIFVHKFSRPTMPLTNLFKNCAYYWCFGAVIGYPLCSPSYAPPADLQVTIGLVIFVLCELGNLICHLMLSNMRPAEGNTSRSIPRGFLFELVACPNYTFEVTSWIGFSIMTQIPFSYLFTIVGFLQVQFPFLFVIQRVIVR